MMLHVASITFFYPMVLYYGAFFGYGEKPLKSVDVN